MSSEDVGTDPDLPQTIPGVLDRAAARFAGLEAIVDRGADGEEVRITFAELAERVDVAARALVATGIEHGDRVAIWAPNLHEWVVASLAIHRVGATLVTLNTRYKGPEAAYILQRSKARLLFTVTDFLDTDYVALLGDRAEVPSVEQIVVLRGPQAAADATWAAFLARADEIDPAVTAARAAAVTAGDVSDILFTSGTTGAPKGAMLGHGASVRAFDAWASIVGLTEGDRYLVINPFFHSFGLKAGILASVIKGATIVPHPVFDVPSAMARIAEERITMLPGPPAIYQTILDHPDKDAHDLSSLRLAVTGAAAVPVEMIKRMRSELTFRTILTAYGLTESTGVVTICRQDDDPETIATTSGRAIPDVEVATVDDDGVPVPAGEPGEVVVRGYNVLLGYFEDPEATAAAVDADGWLHTGDIGILDPAGNLRITDRKKDMFIVGGFNAYPAEIENVLLGHEAISQAAVVGVPDHRMGEVGLACVVLRPGATLDPDELITWCRERMANYKVPRFVEVRDALPMNASNKVLKYQLRDEAVARLGDIAP